MQEYRCTVDGITYMVAADTPELAAGIAVEKFVRTHEFFANVDPYAVSAWINGTEYLPDTWARNGERAWESPYQL